MKAHPLKWTEHQPPNESSHYDHVTSQTPIGIFCIEWKSWKEYDSYCLTFDGDFVDALPTLEEAKARAGKFILDKLLELAPLVLLEEKDRIHISDRIALQQKGHPLEETLSFWLYGTTEK